MTDPVFSYAPAPEPRSAVSLRSEYGLFVDGVFTDPTDARTPSVDPATEETLATVSVAGQAEVDRAVTAARRALDTVWAPLAPAERGKYLFRVARIVQERARELAVAETLDSGRPIRLTRDVDLPLAAGHLLSRAGWADKLAHLGHGPSPRPLGVAAQLLPGRLPLPTLAAKVASALATGNTVVAKPAAGTPLTALLFAEICQEARLPPGVVNIVTGPAATGRALVAHPGVDTVAFTGSTEAGRATARTVATTRARLTLDVDGGHTVVVYADAAVDQAVDAVLDDVFVGRGGGHRTGARLLVQEPVAEAVLERLRAETARLRLGDPLDRNTDVGALGSAAHRDRLRAFVETCGAEGARCWSPPGAPPERGFWSAPTVLTGAGAASRIVRERIGGPVLAVATFRTPAEAVAKANNTPFGQSAGVWTQQGARALWTAERLRATTVWANTRAVVDPAASDGTGWVHGHGLEAYLDG